LSELPESASNVERMRYFVEQVQTNGRVDLIDELVAEDFMNYTAELPQTKDRAGVHFIVNELRSAFEGFRADILHIVGDGDMVATYKVFSGVHNGSWLGIPASGKPVEFQVFDLVRYRDGQLLEHWAVIDSATMLKQIGILS
jgi:predicted ester cyclase